MTSLFDKWNLRPGERRLVVVVAIVVFIVANVIVVFPKFGGWGRTEAAIVKARDELKKFKEEFSRTNTYSKQLEFLKLQGGSVATDERDLAMLREVTSQANLDQVQIIRTEPSRSPITARTNSFFEEQSLLVTFNATETNLVNFLFNLGARNSLIRVGSMQLSRDPSQTRLQGSITFVGSFQKKPPPKIALAVPAAAAPAKAATTAPPAKASEPPKVTPAPKPVKPAAAPKTAPTPQPARPPAATVPSPIAPKPTNLPKRVVSPEKAK